MKSLLSLSSSTGETVTFELQLEESLGPQRSGKGRSVTAAASQTLEEALAGVKPASEAVLKHLLGLSNRPTGIEVEFGIKVSAEAGTIIASGSLEANYIVKLKWEQKESVGDGIVS